jgi:hypothetical protein
VPGLRSVWRLGAGEHIGIVVEAAAGDQSPLYGPLAIADACERGVSLAGRALLPTGPALGKPPLHELTDRHARRRPHAFGVGPDDRLRELDVGALAPALVLGALTVR